jgi:hypothetical protein
MIRWRGTQLGRLSRRELQKATEAAIAQALRNRDMGEADRRLDAVAFGFMLGALVAAAGFIAGAMLA